jgi:hypothetical protein
MTKELQSITLVSIILPKSAGREHWRIMFFYFDGSLVELAIPSAGAEMLSCELLSNHRCQVLPDKKVVNAGMPEKVNPASAFLPVVNCLSSAFRHQGPVEPLVTE